GSTPATFRRNRHAGPCQKSLRLHSAQVVFRNRPSSIDYGRCPSAKLECGRALPRSTLRQSCHRVDRDFHSRTRSSFLSDLTYLMELACPWQLYTVTFKIARLTLNSRAHLARNDSQESYIHSPFAPQR